MRWGRTHREREGEKEADGERIPTYAANAHTTRDIFECRSFDAILGRRVDRWRSKILLLLLPRELSLVFC